MHESNESVKDGCDLPLKSGQMKGGELSVIFRFGTETNVDAEEEQNSFEIVFLNGSVQVIQAPLVVLKQTILPSSLRLRAKKRGRSKPSIFVPSPPKMSTFQTTSNLKPV